MRITIETVRSGQPRAYADTEHVYQVFFEHKPWSVKGQSKEWVPYEISPESAELICSGLPGWYPKTRKEVLHGLDGYRDYFRAVDPLENGNASRWEIRNVSPYTG